MPPRPLLIPVLLGTIRRGARSAAVARLVATRTAAHPDVETRLLTIDDLGLATDDEGTSIADAEFSVKQQRSEYLEAGFIRQCLEHLGHFLQNLPLY